MVKGRQEVNAVKQDDGHSALHIAAANNYLDIVCLLAALVLLYTTHTYYILYSFFSIGICI